MAPIVHRGGTASTGIVTVAELLTRNIPAQRTAPDEERTGPTTGTYISVGSLLRREGRAPHAIDRPVQPRASQLAEEAAAAEATSGRSVPARRAAIAAGTLLAAGSVLTAAVLTDAASNSSDAREALDGTYPGRGVLDAAPGGSASLPGLGAVSTLAGAPGLDSGIAAPASWMAVAFPTALPTAPSASTGGSGSGPVTAVPGRGTAAPAPGAGSPAAPLPGVGGPGAPAGPVGQAVSAPAGAVGRAVQDVGGAAPAPLQKPLESVGGTVTETGGNLGNTLDSGVNTVQKLAEPVTSALSPSARAAAPAEPEPVLTTVTEGVSDVADGVGETVGGLAGGAGRTVGGLLD
ncbi:hypothetical protein ACVGVM_04600 [Pseudonocardia bannensis]|uniref:Uncharacterized protein n=1 Tax=Pseudonocardia bannensis TaxID=630973 RepID=A0A848DPG0_9PSEU|nr:hypothetical protein [Pseudonocardia bannensis]NMH94403.1 hypothetical protein [Pseudonocardia bannensis]